MAPTRPPKSYQPRSRRAIQPLGPHQSFFGRPSSPPEPQQLWSRQHGPLPETSQPRSPPQTYQPRSRQVMSPLESRHPRSPLDSGQPSSRQVRPQSESPPPNPLSPPDSLRSPTSEATDPNRPVMHPWRGPRARVRTSPDSRSDEDHVVISTPRRNARTNRPPAVKPYSTHRGPNREGYSEPKCRNVLARQCGHIPRNFNYVDGFHKVIYVLREHLGDENLDLAIGVLYELIEVNDTIDTWQDGSAYRRWAHDHSLRNEDLCCPHTLRLKNIVVGRIQPTERLKRWRREKLRELMAASGNPPMSRIAEIEAGGPMAWTSHGIRNRHSWQINYSTFVTTPNLGTTIMFCPTPAQLNTVAFHEGIARGHRPHAATLSSAAAQFVTRPKTLSDLPNTPPPTPTLPNVTKKRSSKWKRDCRLVRRAFRSAFCFRPSRAAEKAEEGIALTEMAASPGRSSIAIDFDVNKEAAENEIAPDGARVYTNEDGSQRYVLENFPLPMHAQINAAFMRKHGLINYDEELPAHVRNFGFHTAEEKALKDELALKLSMRSEGDTYDSVLNIRTTHRPFDGPFTSELFYDGGLDYKWKTATETVVEEVQSIFEAARSRRWGAYYEKY